ncbi:cytochrome P450 [Mycena latifolia]|nr:cytochrome P450 [Mycena latifolia]
MQLLQISTVLSLALSAYLILRLIQQRRKHNPNNLPLPPGPPPSFLVGNLRDLPKTPHEWSKFAKMSEQYDSDVVFLRVLGTPVLCINSAQAASDLLDRQSVVFSDRPRLPLLKELTGWSWNLVIMSYHEGFSAHRKLVQQHLQPSIVAEKYRSVMEAETRVLLSSLAARPDDADLAKILRRMAGAIIMKVTYGHQIVDGPDEFLDLAEEVRTGAPKQPAGAAIVDMFPLLMHIPAWFPGASFKREALSRRHLARRMRDAPYNKVKEDIARGKASTPSLVGSMIEDRFAGEDIDEELIKNCGGVIYHAGADTTVAALINFVWAMMLHPTIQKRAQEELDRVVGRSRLPSFEDQDKLVYLGCILKETLRWRSVAPLGVPHQSTKAVEYRGWHIPQRTTVMANIWAMSHDESIYEDHESFNPDRFAPDAAGPRLGADPTRFLYGFGRRICPGRYFASDSIFIAMASILHTFTLSKPLDSAGLPIEQNVEWGSGIVSMPSRFTCSFQERPLVE